MYLSSLMAAIIVCIAWKVCLLLIKADDLPVASVIVLATILPVAQVDDSIKIEDNYILLECEAIGGDGQDIYTPL